MKTLLTLSYTVPLVFVLLVGFMRMAGPLSRDLQARRAGAQFEPEVTYKQLFLTVMAALTPVLNVAVIFTWFIADVMEPIVSKLMDKLDRPLVRNKK